MRKALVLEAVAVAVALLTVALPMSTSGGGLIIAGKVGLSAFEQQLNASYDANNAFGLARYLSTPNDGWSGDVLSRIGKVSGTPEERAAARFIRDKLIDYGVEDVSIREYPTTSWVFHGSELRVVDPEGGALYP